MEDITSSSIVYEVTDTEETNNEDCEDFDDRSRSTEKESGSDTKTNSEDGR